MGPENMAMATRDVQLLYDAERLHSHATLAVFKQEE